MKKIIIGIMALTSLSSFAATCLENKTEFKAQVTQALIDGIPSMATPDRQKPGYEKAYNKMLNQVYSNVQVVDKILDTVCEEQKASVKKVKSLEI